MEKNEKIALAVVATVVGYIAYTRIQRRINHHRGARMANRLIKEYGADEVTMAVQYVNALLMTGDIQLNGVQALEDAVICTILQGTM